MQAEVHDSAPASRPIRICRRCWIGGDARDPVTNQEITGGACEPRLVPRLADDRPTILRPHKRKEPGGYTRFERERRRQLNEQRSALVPETGGLIEKSLECRTRPPQLLVVGNRARHFNRVAKRWRRTTRPLCIRRCTVGSMKRRIDFGARKYARVALKMRPVTGTVMRRGPRNRPSCGTDVNPSRHFLRAVGRAA